LIDKNNQQVPLVKEKVSLIQQQQQDLKEGYFYRFVVVFVAAVVFIFLLFKHYKTL
jgi:hypothetical protein